VLRSRASRTSDFKPSAIASRITSEGVVESSSDFDARAEEELCHVAASTRD